VKSTLNSNYESLRFINSAGSFSPDGATSPSREASRPRRPRDPRREEGRRGPPHPRAAERAHHAVVVADGKQLVFTGYDGGLSDLFSSTPTARTSTA